MTTIGLTPADIAALYHAQEPGISSIVAAAMALSDPGRRLATALLRTLAASEAIEDKRAT